MELKDFLNQIAAMSRSYGNSVNIRAAKQYLNERTVDLFGTCLWYCSDCKTSGAFVYLKAEDATKTWKKVKTEHNNTDCLPTGLSVIRSHNWHTRIGYE